MTDAREAERKALLIEPLMGRVLGCVFGASLAQVAAAGAD